jgi:hypothetical protein
MNITIEIGGPLADAINNLAAAIAGAKLPDTKADLSVAMTYGEALAALGKLYETLPENAYGEALAKAPDTPTEKASTGTKARTKKAEPVSAQVEEGPFYWSHPESDSFGEVANSGALFRVQASFPCVEAISKEQYAALKARTKKEVAPEPDPTSGPASSQTAPATQDAIAENVVGNTSKSHAPEGPSLKDLQTEILRVAREKGHDAAAALLAQFGARKVSEVKPEDGARLIAAAKEI